MLIDSFGVRNCVLNYRKLNSIISHLYEIPYLDYIYIYMIPNCGIVRRILPIYRIWWYVMTSILRFLFANCVVAHWNISLFLFQPLSFFSVILCSILINVPQASASLDDEGLCDSIWFHSILSRFNSFLPIRTKSIPLWESPKAHRHCFLRRIPCSGSNIIRFYGFWLQCLPLDWSGFWRQCMPMQCYVCIWMASMLMLMFILVLVMIAMMLSHTLYVLVRLDI